MEVIQQVHANDEFVQALNEPPRQDDVTSFDEATKDTCVQIKTPKTNGHQEEVDEQADALGTTYYGQLTFFHETEDAGEDRQLMAKIALNVAGYKSDYPVLLSDILSQLSTPKYQAVVAFLTLSSHVRVVWYHIHLRLLKYWAAPPINARED